MNVFNSNKVVRKASFTRQLKNSLTSQLLADIVETVAALLGHSSTKITEKSYSHWVKGRQEKLEEAVKNSWAQLGTVEESA
jgi:integrase